MVIASSLSADWCVKFTVWPCIIIADSSEDDTVYWELWFDYGHNVLFEVFQTKCKCPNIVLLLCYLPYSFLGSWIPYLPYAISYNCMQLQPGCFNFRYEHKIKLCINILTKAKHSHKLNVHKIIFLNCIHFTS